MFYLREVLCRLSCWSGPSSKGWRKFCNCLTTSIPVILHVYWILRPALDFQQVVSEDSYDFSHLVLFCPTFDRFQAWVLLLQQSFPGTDCCIGSLYKAATVSAVLSEPDVTVDNFGMAAVVVAFSALDSSNTNDF